MASLPTPLFSYFLKYEVSKKAKRGKVCKGIDSRQHHVYERDPKDIVRFTDYHPRSNPDGFFYNLLLEKDEAHFRDELELLSNENPDGTFMTECIIRGFLESPEQLEELVLEYSTRHMYRDDQLGQLMEQLLSVYNPAVAALGDSLDGGLPARTSTINTDDLSQRTLDAVARRLPSAQALAAEFRLGEGRDPRLFPDQQAAFDKIKAMKSGLALLTGGPGSGKTYLTQLLSHYFKSKLGRSVLLSASTGAASVRLSRSASTNHANFKIPVGGHLLYPLQAADPVRAVLSEASVIFIDEMSMVNTEMLTNILNRLMQIHRLSSIQALLNKVLIVLVGDHAQVICLHTVVRSA